MFWIELSKHLKSFSMRNDGDEVYIVDARVDEVHEPGKFIIKVFFMIFQFYNIVGVWNLFFWTTSVEL